MSSHRSTLIHGGGVFFLILITMIVLTMMPFGTATAQASDRSETEQSGTSLGQILRSGGASGYLIILLGAAALILTVVGAIALKGEDSWRHWRPLVRGLGEAAFLVGIFGSVMGMIMAFNEITRLGAAVTPRDLSAGLSTALVTVLLGTVVSLGTLVCAGVLRLIERAPTTE